MSRYIDAEQAGSKIAEVAESYAFYDEDEYEMGYYHALTFVLNEFKKAQIADVEPVVHSHWKDYATFFSCSNCEHCFDNIFDADHCYIWQAPNYCPNCGAKMDELIVNK